MIEQLPLVNACINAAVAVLLVLGFWLIHRGRREAHERVMIAAVVLSAIFLVSYVTYHAKHGSTPFTGTGIVRPIYFTILISHTILAVVNLPFVVLTFARGLRKNFPAHLRIAKRTWAVWLYVAITGPIVYLMLHAYAQPAPQPQPIFSEAQRLNRAGDDQLALAKYREAAALGHRAARCYAAVIGDRLEGTDTATTTLAKALEEDPRDAHCRVLYARELVWNEETDKAIAILRDVAREQPSEPFFLASLGYAEFRAGKYRDAAAAFEKSIALDGELSANVFNAGYAHELDGDFTQAKPLLERALALGLPEELAQRAHEELDVIAGKLWVCPMHPDQVGKPGENCPVCGMKLERSPHTKAD